MTVISMQRLASDIRSHARELTDEVGFIPQATDRPLEAADLLFYISETSMPMAEFLRRHGLFVDSAGLHFDIAQFGAIRELADNVISEREANDLDGVWREFDLSTDEDIDGNGTYILTALAALDLLYGPRT